MKKTAKQPLKRRLFLALFSLFFACSALFSFLPTTPVYADPKPTTTETTSNSETKNPKTTENPSESEKTEENKFTDEDLENVCNNQSGALGWLICPSSGAISKAVDSIYATIEDFLVINPIPADSSSTIHIVWDYVKGFTNIVFIIFLLVVVISHLTGFGLANYGWKRILPRLIIVGILVNLSFIICQIAVDISNLLGYGLRDLFLSVEENAIMSGAIRNVAVTWTDLVNVVTGAATAAGIGIALSGGLIAVFWTLVPVLLGAIVSIAIGFITIAMRQALVAVLVMISPLAFVCFLLPNTEKWFTKWKDTLFKMLIFYPAFSFLFGASHLAGWAIITSSVNENGETSGFGVLLGLAVQVFPLFFSWSLMKMSGTILGTVNQKLHGLAAKPLSAVSRISESNRDYARRKYYANSHGVGATAHKYMDYRKQLRETDAANLKSIYDTDIQSRINRKLQSGYSPNNPEKNDLKANTYLRNAKRASISKMKADTASADTAHVLDKYGDFYGRKSLADARLGAQSANAWFDYNRAVLTKDTDDENDIEYLTGRYLEANKRDANGNPIDRIAYNRYIRSIAGADGEQRVLAKVISQAGRIEAKQRAEFSILHAKFGHNGYNKKTFRSWITGYMVDDDGWAIDANGNRLYELDEHGRIKKDAHGHKIYLEKIQGDALTKAPERLVLYDKKDAKGFYYDMQDQDGNIVARIHRSGPKGESREDSAFIKETLANFDIPIGDPINDIYNILSGVKVGDIITPQGENAIGLDRYSTTIGRANSAYKGNAAWAGAMFNQMVSNRQIHNAAQSAIDILDSIIKTSKPGALNTQNPASVAKLRAILTPNNWPAIFREGDINGCNINDKYWGGEDWVLDENGHPVLNENGEIQFTPVENPNYEQKMNYLKRKFLFPAMEKVVPSVIRNTSPNTIDNQKPGAADEWSKFIDMIMEEWVSNPSVPDPNIRKYDLLNQTAELKAVQRDRDGNPIYPRVKIQGRHHEGDSTEINPLAELRNICVSSMTSDDLVSSILSFLDKHEYYDALEAFDNYITGNGGSSSTTIGDITDFVERTLSLYFVD